MKKKIDSKWEYLEVFDIYWNYIWLEERSEYYKKWKADTQIKRTIALILTPDWKIILQKRSKSKDVNSWMYDKSVWWHTMVFDWYRFAWSLEQELSDINMAKELIEELNIPSNIVSKHFFNDSLLFPIDRMAFLIKLERLMWYESERINKDWTKFIQPYISENYIWYYNWTIQFIDWEVSWLEYLTRDEILEWMKKYPEMYTLDLKFMIERYYNYLLPIDDFVEKFSKDWSEFSF